MTTASISLPDALGAPAREFLSKDHQLLIGSERSDAADGRTGPANPHVADVHLGFHGQPDLQRVRSDFVRIEADPHGYALHDLDPIARGVLSRQQRKSRARPRSKTGHGAMVMDAVTVQVGCQGYGLTDTHAGKLWLLEVGIHPQTLCRHDGN